MTVEQTDVQRCPACAATVPAGATWCGQCYRPVPAPGTPPAAAVTSTWRPGAARREPPPPPPRTSRWRKTETTFGPIGRIVCTVLLVAPFLGLLAAGLLVMDPFVLGGAVVWGGVIMPWGLRDTWRAGVLSARG